MAREEDARQQGEDVALRARAASLRHSLQDWRDAMRAFLESPVFDGVEEAAEAMRAIERIAAMCPVSPEQDGMARLAQCELRLGRLAEAFRRNIPVISAKTSRETARAWELQIESILHYRRSMRKLARAAQRAARCI